MRLDEARALKQALLEGTVALRVEEGEDIFDLRAQGAFVGIAPGAEPGSYRLAVRLTREVADREAYDAAIRAVAGDDVEIRYVGEVRALGEPSGSEVTRTVTARRRDRQPGAEVDPPATDALPTPEELQQRIRPLVRGASVAHRDVTAGTIGGFVSISGGAAVHVLSNNHVLGNSDHGEPGDDVLQPGPADGGSAADRIGELLKTVPLDPDNPNLVDTAVAVLDADIEIDTTAHDGAIAGLVDAADVVGQVAKIGRTTGYTTGRITAFEVDGVQVGYDTGVFSFDDQVEIEGVDGGFSAGGDSGSLIYTETERQGVGLLFAGSTTGGSDGSGVTYANSLSNVLTALDAALL